MEILKIFSEFLSSFLTKHKSFVGADKMHEGLFEIFQFEFILYDLSKEWKNACKKIDCCYTEQFHDELWITSRNFPIFNASV